MYEKIIIALALFSTLFINAQEFKSVYNKGKLVVNLPERYEWKIQADDSEFKYYALSAVEYKQSTEELLAILETYQESILKPSNDKSILKGKVTLFDYESIVNKALNGSVSIDMIWVTKSKDKVMFKTNGREVLIIIVPKTI